MDKCLLFCLVATIPAACAWEKRVEMYDVPEEVERIEIDIGSGACEIRAAKVASVQIDAELVGDVQLRRRVDGRTLHLSQDCEWFSPCDLDLSIVVPPSTAIYAEAGSGSLTAHNLRADAIFQAGSGSIEVDGAIASSLSLDTGSGDITARELAVGNVTGSTGSGGISLAVGTAARSIDLSTGSGNIAVTLPAGEYDIETDAGSGDVDVAGVTRLTGAEHRLALRTGSGDINVVGR